MKLTLAWTRRSIEIPKDLVIDVSAIVVARELVTQISTQDTLYLVAESIEKVKRLLAREGN